MFSYSGGKVWNTRITSNYSGMIWHNLQFAISGNNRVFIHYYTCIYAVDIMVGIIQDKSAGVIWNVSRVLQHALCAETFQIFPRFLKMQIGAIHGRFCQNVSSLLQTALAPNAPGVCQTERSWSPDGLWVSGAYLARTDVDPRPVRFEVPRGKAGTPINHEVRRVFICVYCGCL